MTNSEYKKVNEKLDKLIEQVASLSSEHEKNVLTEELNRISTLMVFWSED